MCRNLPISWHGTKPTGALVTDKLVIGLNACLAQPLFDVILHARPQDHLAWSGYMRQLHFLQAAPLAIVLEVLNCTKGQFSLNAVQCSSCPPGTYNLDASNQCKQCPEGA